MKKTMQKIAQELGVSRTTVSLVLNGDSSRYRISDETRDRILEYAATHGYRPNYFASALNRKRTGVIGVVFPNVFEGFMNETIKGIEDVMYARELTMMVCTSRFEPRMEKRHLEELLYRGVDGILLVYTTPFLGEEHDFTHLEDLQKRDVAVVCIDRYHPHLEFPYVVQDDTQGTAGAVEALEECGCQRLGFVGFDLVNTAVQSRKRSFDETCALRNIQVRDEWNVFLRQRNPEAQDLEVPLRNIMKSPERPDGFFVSTNGLSHRTASILQAECFTVGKDIHIAKFGNDPEYITTPMISVLQPNVEMGRRATELLLRMIDGGSVDAKERYVVVPTVVRKP